jgi:hypothetical protein
MPLLLWRTCSRVTNTPDMCCTATIAHLVSCLKVLHAPLRVSHNGLVPWLPVGRAHLGAYASQNAAVATAWHMCCVLGWLSVTHSLMHIAAACRADTLLAKAPRQLSGSLSPDVARTNAAHLSILCVELDGLHQPQRLINTATNGLQQHRQARSKAHGQAHVSRRLCCCGQGAGVPGWRPSFPEACCSSWLISAHSMTHRCHQQHCKLLLATALR